MAQLIDNVGKFSLAAKVYMDGTFTVPKRRSQSSSPMNVDRTKKSYSMKPTVKRNIRSKGIAIYLSAKRNGNIAVFYTLTCSDVPRIENNKPVRYYFENVRKNLNVLQYVWVRERHKGGHSHWHVIAEITPTKGQSRTKPLDYKKHKKAWSKACKTAGGRAGGCGVRFGEKPILYSAGGVFHYVTKYVTKHGEVESYPITHSSQITYKFSTSTEHMLQCHNKITFYRVATWAVCMRFSAGMSLFEYARSCQAKHDDIINKLFEYET